MPARSKRTASRQYRKEVPRGIKSKIKRLKEHEDRIPDLHASIIALERQLRALENELQPYRLVLVPDHTTSVNQLPDELLIFIFEYALNGCHPNINRLLRVSRRWHNIILSTAALWARIELIPQKNRHGRSTLPEKLYIETCYLRSMDAPLHINLDYRQLPSVRGYQLEEKKYLFGLLREEGEDVSLLEELWAKREHSYDAVEDMEYYGREPEAPLGHKKLLKRALALVSELAVDEYMQRWEELAVHAPQNLVGQSYDDISEESPEHQLAFHLLDSLCWPVPNLVKLHLCSISQPYFIDPDYDNRDVQLRELSLSNDGVDFISRRVLSDTLERLTTGNLRGASDLMSFRHLRLLQELTIGYIHGSPRHETYTLSFPHLRKMAFLKVESLLDTVKFQSPVLEQLYICSSGKRAPLIIPTRLLVWKHNTGYIPYQAPGSSKDVKTYKEELDSAFGWLGLAHGLVVYGVPKERIVEYLETKDLPLTLHVVQTKRSDGTFKNLYFQSSTD